MQKQKLIQTDQRILRFWGDELYSASTKKGPDDEHWKIVRIFRGKDFWVVGVAHITSYSLEERDLFAAFEAKNKEEVIALVNGAVPELTEDVAKRLLHPVNRERSRKELEKWKKRTPLNDLELSLLSGSDGNHVQHHP